MTPSENAPLAAPRRWLLVVLAMALCVPLSSCFQTQAIHPRPDTWAQPIESEKLPNLHRVSSKLYRSALPRDGGYAAARDYGIKTVVNLRPGDLDEEDHPPGLKVVQIPVETSDPEYAEARRFFSVVDDPANQPVLLHCYHGADRTGAFTALYRINRQGWEVEEAIREMTGGGFHFHVIWKSLIEWVEEAPEF